MLVATATGVRPPMAPPAEETAWRRRRQQQRPDAVAALEADRRSPGLISLYEEIDWQMQVQNS